jgi:hypothetical protein
MVGFDGDELVEARPRVCLFAELALVKVSLLTARNTKEVSKEPEKQRRPEWNFAISQESMNLQSDGEK